MPKELVDTTRLIEEISGNAWRPMILQDYAGWQMGYSGGSSRRVNSVLTHHMEGQVRLEERLALVNAFYQRRHRPVIFKISPATLPTHLPKKLAERGYVVDAETNIQTTTLDTLLTSSTPPQKVLVSSPTCTDRWFETYTSANGYPDESLPIRRGIFSRIGPLANFILLEHEGIPVATGLGVVERGWLGIFSMVTRQDTRRRGYANQILHALGVWAKQLGAEDTYLQVMENNPPALALYARLGFRKVYSYYYLVGPTPK